MTKIIILGRCCRISFDLIAWNYKQESSLFEWTWTDHLSEINFIIEKIIKKEPIQIHLKNGNHYIDTTSIKTCHYINKDYSSIFQRRAERFIHDCQKKDSILFIRDDVCHTANLIDIQCFYNLVQQINPMIHFKFLLLSDGAQYQEMVFPNLYHKIHNADLYPTYINECFPLEDRRMFEDELDKKSDLSDTE